MTNSAQEIDSTSATGRLLFAILAAVAEMEHGLISERVKEGMDRAKAEGKHVGRPARRRAVSLHPRFGAVSALVLEKRLSVKAGAKALGVNEHSFRAALPLGSPKGLALRQSKRTDPRDTQST